MEQTKNSDSESQVKKLNWTSLTYFSNKMRCIISWGVNLYESLFIIESRQDQNKLILQEDNGNAAAKSDVERLDTKTSWVAEREMTFDTLKALEFTGWLQFLMSIQSTTVQYPSEMVFLVHFLRF